MPTPPNMRRIDYMAASVTSALLSRPEVIQNCITEEQTTGVSRNVIFAKLAYDVAQALTDESEIRP